MSWLRRKESAAANISRRCETCTTLYESVRLLWKTTRKNFVLLFASPISHSSIADKEIIEKHKETKAHKDNVKSVERTLIFFHRPTQESDLPPSIAAEVAWSMMLVQHNTFMNISDHLTPIINKYYKDSDAGKAYICRRTKTAAIVNCIGDMAYYQAFQPCGLDGWLEGDIKKTLQCWNYLNVNSTV